MSAMWKGLPITTENHPRKWGREEVREYLLYLIEDRRVSWGTYNIALCALRFLYHRTLKREQLLQGIPCPKGEVRLPVVLSPSEVKQFFAACDTLKQSALFMRELTPLACAFQNWPNCESKTSIVSGCRSTCG